jgi:alpha-beta hydrolase superfamily lysophospholipase
MAPEDSPVTMRSREKRLLNQVQRDDVYREVLVDSGGVPIALSVWSGTGGGGTVVFLPGTMTHPLFYEELLNALCGGGFNIVGVHFREHGKSPRLATTFTFEDLIEDAAAAISFAREHFGPEVMVLGSSQGGILAMAVAGQDPTLKAVFAHNILDPTLPESMSITRFPAIPNAIYGAFRGLMRVGALLFPRLPVPLALYLNPTRIFGEAWTRELFYADPLNRTAYPLRFLASLFSGDMSFLRSGAIACPVVVIGATGDPLFRVDYIRRVFDELLVAEKELWIVDSEHHLILNEDLPLVVPELLERLRSS